MAKEKFGIIGEEFEVSKEDVVKYCNELISNLNKEIEEFEEDYENEFSSFYDMGIDKYGAPNSEGNYNDTYSDGFDNGEMQGKYNLAHKILKLLSL